MNISFQVDVGNNSYIHLRIFKVLPHIGSYVELHDVKTGMTKKDSLDIFGKWNLSAEQSRNIFYIKAM